MAKLNKLQFTLKKKIDVCLQAKVTKSNRNFISSSSKAGDLDPCGSTLVTKRGRKKKMLILEESFCSA